MGGNGRRYKFEKGGVPGIYFTFPLPLQGCLSHSIFILPYVPRLQEGSCTTIPDFKLENYFYKTISSFFL